MSISLGGRRFNTAERTLVSMSNFAKGWDWTSLIAPLMVAILVGVGSSYVTTRNQIGTMRERMRQAETDIERVQSALKRRRETRADLRARVTRIETKIDLLLQNNKSDR
jgi:septal ring factor EnvC (AmiA/AmiB activator)